MVLYLNEKKKQFEGKKASQRKWPLNLVRKDESEFSQRDRMNKGWKQESTWNMYEQAGRQAWLLFKVWGGRADAR